MRKNKYIVRSATLRNTVSIPPHKLTDFITSNSFSFTPVCGNLLAYLISKVMKTKIALKFFTPADYSDEFKEFLQILTVSPNSLIKEFYAGAKIIQYYHTERFQFILIKRMTPVNCNGHKYIYGIYEKYHYEQKLQPCANMANMTEAKARVKVWKHVYDGRMYHDFYNENLARDKRKVIGDLKKQGKLFELHSNKLQKCS